MRHFPACVRKRRFGLYPDGVCWACLTSGWGVPHLTPAQRCSYSQLLARRRSKTAGWLSGKLCGLCLLSRSTCSASHLSKPDGSKNSLAVGQLSRPQLHLVPRCCRCRSLTVSNSA